MTRRLAWLLALLVLAACGTAGGQGTGDPPADRDLQEMRTRLERADVDLYLPSLRGTVPVEVETAKNGDVTTTFVDPTGDGTLDRWSLRQATAPRDLCRRVSEDADCSSKDGVLRSTFEEMSKVGVVRGDTLLTASLVTEDDGALLGDAVTAFGDARRVDPDALLDEIGRNRARIRAAEARERRADPQRRALADLSFRLWLPDLRGADPSWTEVGDDVVVTELQGIVFSYRLRQSATPTGDPCRAAAGWQDCRWDGATLTAQRGRDVLVGVVRDGTLLTITRLNADDAPPQALATEALTALRGARPAKPATFAVAPSGGRVERDDQLAAELEQTALTLFRPTIEGTRLVSSSIDQVGDGPQTVLSGYWPVPDTAIFPVREEPTHQLEQSAAPIEDPCAEYASDSCAWDGRILRRVDDGATTVGVVRGTTYLEVPGIDTAREADRVLAAVRAAPRVSPADLAVTS